MRSAIECYTNAVCADIVALHLFLPSISTSISLIQHPLATVQYAARQAVNCAIKFSTKQQVEETVARLEKEVENAATVEDKYRAIATMAIIAIETNNNSSDSPSFYPTREYTDSVATLLLDYIMERKSSCEGDVLMDLFAEGWDIFYEHISDLHGLLNQIFFTFCTAQHEGKSYRQNSGARLMTVIATRSFKQYSVFAEKLFSGQLGSVPGQPAGVRISTLYVFLRLIQSSPEVAAYCFTKILGFVWKAVDPHSPQKEMREACLPVVTLLLHNAVRYLPMVSFRQQNQRIAVGVAEGHITVYDIKTTGKVAVLSAHPKGVACVAYSTVGDEIASIGVDLSDISVWRCDAGSGILSSILSSASTFRLACTIKIKRPAQMIEGLRALGNNIPFSEVVKSCRLLWISPHCLQLTTPWHANEHYNIV